MNVPSASNFISRVGLSHQKAEVTNSPGSRYNKGKIGRTIDHIFYAELSGKENWAADQLINSNRFSPLIDADINLNQLSEGLIDTLWTESKRIQATTAATEV
ncbi:hypothetical protein AYI68_g5434 [Smittium mucronatum]|uniref:Uncharacterized protein n=1 Tax=Smittium mucronatum TaxID=133383 RepID=A0A1R0GU89_9FUNG|nr:hypothetical protein AYI68_g5434 [Smittium mucronatum]